LNITDNFQRIFIVIYEGKIGYYLGDVYYEIGNKYDKIKSSFEFNLKKELEETEPIK
jgi:hypothetical protein